jgi:DNA modification methylase
MVIIGDVRKELQHLEMASVRTCVTSPPYFGLRDYGHDGQIGLEQTPEEYVEQMVDVFRLVRNVLTDDGTLWLNLGDSYNGSGGAGGDYNKNGLKEGQPKYPGRNLDCLKPKDLMGIPESVTDRPTKSHEHLFLLTKSAKYYYDHEAIKEDGVISAGTKYAKGSEERASQSGVNARPPEYKIADGKRNKRDVWTINTKPFRGAHFAVMPEALVEPCILAGSASGDTVLDPFTGSGTVGVVAKRHGRKFVGVELNPEYAEMAEQRINNEPERML